MGRKNKDGTMEGDDDDYNGEEAKYDQKQSKYTNHIVVLNPNIL